MDEMTAQGSYFFLLLLLMNAWTIEAETKDTKLILFLLDGFRWDYFDQPNVNLPGFKRLFNKGVRANYTTSDFPTLSIPNYYTIMTGLHTESHGMVDNYMYDENIDTLFLLDNLTTWDNPAWWQGGEPLWVTTEKQDKSSYMFYWPGCDVEIRDKKPTFCKPYYNDHGNLPGVASMSYATNEAIQLFKNDSADMVGIYVETSDFYGHAFGPSSPELYQKLQEIDGVLGQLLNNLTAEGLEDEVVIMIFSDHGMTGVTPQKIIQLTDYIDIQDLRSPVLGAGATCSIWPRDDKMDKVYNDTMKAKNERGHIEVYKKDDIPDKWYYKNNDRVAPITVLADLGYFLLQPYYQVYPNLAGNHGHDPKYPDMKGIFVAAGPGIQKSRIVKSLHLVDIYQLMCHVLKITPSPHNGTWSHVKDILTDTSSAPPSLYNLLSVTIPVFITISISFN